MAIGASGRPYDAYRSANLIGKELAALGVNMNFAPSVDLATKPKSYIIGSRAPRNGLPATDAANTDSFLDKLRRPAIRALGPCHRLERHQDFAVLLAGVAVKLVNRHGGKIAASGRISSPRFLKRLRRTA